MIPVRKDSVVDEPHSEGRIELVLPADTRLVRVARLVASGVATTAGFDVEEVEDLRIAVDELCTALVEGGDGGDLLLGFDLGNGEVTILGTTSAAGVAAFEPERLALSRQILAVVVDEHELVTDHGQISVRLHKRRADLNGDD
jgi:serine/threonine-protein kinase RsbW